jgi:hypothetical protein
VGVMLKDMQWCGVIEDSDSPWSSPVVLARNKNGDLCFCVDYSKPNDAGLLKIQTALGHLLLFSPGRRMGSCASV